MTGRRRPPAIARAAATAALAALPAPTPAVATPDVPGTHRMLARGGAEPAGDRLAAVGELLLAELACTRCHQRARTHPPGRWVAAPPPDLPVLAPLLEPGYITRFLADPASADPGSRMPDALAALPLAERPAAAAELAAFLSPGSTARGPRTAEVAIAIDAGAIDRGRQLFHTVGCVACHPPEPGYRPDGQPAGNTSTKEPARAAPSLSLENVAKKFRPGGLAAFLRNPLAARPAGRMPRVPLAEGEAADIEAYLRRGQRAGTTARAVDLDGPHRVDRGRARFGELGCAACHRGPGVPGGDPPTPKATTLADLDPGSEDGCLAADPQPPAARYGLSEEQREALRVALRALREPAPVKAADRVARRVAALDCTACHVRGEGGGPAAGRRVFFRSGGEDLGEEGEVPPPLTGVGRKLLPDALERAIQGRDTARPYLLTRMPDFGPHHAAALARDLAEADRDPAEKPLQRDLDPRQVGRNALGRKLVGTKGKACVACHRLRGEKSLGIQAIDLALLPGRLRPEYFRDYLWNPASFRPATRMPAFWPKGGADREIDSIWVYLSEIDQGRLPAGLENRGDFELVPEGRPVVFRTFVEGAGQRAVALGFPENAHAAFDATDLRWALLWRGRFLDAESTWDDRFTPPAKPLGTDLIRLPAGPAWAVLEQPDDPWPEGARTETSPGRFLGYRLDPLGVPTFRYRMGGLRFEDRLRPDDDGMGLRREIEVGVAPDAPRPAGLLFLRAAAGDEIIARDGGVFQVDNAWALTASGHVYAARITPTKGGQELRLTAEWDDAGRGRLTLGMRWLHPAGEARP